MPYDATLPPENTDPWYTALITNWLGGLRTFVNGLETAIGLRLTTAAAPELIRDTMGTALVAGTNVTVTVNDAGDQITIASVGGSGGGITVEEAVDAVAAALVDSASIDVTYDDGGGTITLAAKGVVARSVIVVTGAEARPAGADVVIWVDPEGLGAANAIVTDPIITPDEGSGGGASASEFPAVVVPPVASRWVIPAFAENDGNEDVGAGRLCLTRWEFVEPVTVTGMATDVFGDPGGSAAVRMGIYAGLDATAPIAGSEVTVAAAAGGNKVNTSMALALPAGVYWVGCAVQGGTIGVRHFKFPISFRFWDEPHNALQGLRNWSDGATISRWVNGVTGALPNLATSTLQHEQESPIAVTLRLG